MTYSFYYVPFKEIPAIAFFNVLTFSSNKTKYVQSARLCVQLCNHHPPQLSSPLSTFRPHEFSLVSQAAASAVPPAVWAAASSSVTRISPCVDAEGAEGTLPAAIEAPVLLCPTSEPWVTATHCHFTLLPGGGKSFCDNIRATIHSQTTHTSRLDLAISSENHS